jgi:HD-GYP domain-containing protein (c-di-GMP phosphodiesterase class II)
LTITIGVATFPDDAVAKEELLDKSDWAMYLAKRRGRDKVMSFAAGQRAGVEEQIAYTPGQGHLALMAQLVDAKDHYAQRRSEAVAQLAAAIGRNLGLNPGAIDEAAEAARHCDIGILGVPEDILNKPATLTDAEWALIREHPVTGEKLYRGLGGDERIALAIAHHHERFDGAGYPAGLKGAAIPLTARVVATAAAYQSMVTHRPYRTRRSEEEALGELRRCAGSQFDPEIVEALSKALSPASAGSRAPA